VNVTYQKAIDVIESQSSSKFKIQPKLQHEDKERPQPVPSWVGPGGLSRGAAWSAGMLA
jgi:hypothetical protein